MFVPTMVYVFFSIKYTAKLIKKEGTDLPLYYATLRTTFLRLLNGVSRTKETMNRGYFAVYRIAKDAPILKYIILLPSSP